MKSLRCVVLSLFACVLSAQGWVDKSGPNGPSPRYGHSMCYDPVRGHTVMVGGNGPGNPFSETWTWDGQQWTSRGLLPVQSYRAKVFWHAQLGKLICVCGVSSGSMIALEWDGANWTNQVTIPGGVYDPSWVGYDQGRQEGLAGINYDRVAVLTAQGWSVRNMVTTIPNPEQTAWDPVTQKLVGALVISNTSRVNVVEWSGYGWNIRTTADAPYFWPAIASNPNGAGVVMFDAEGPWVSTTGSMMADHTWFIVGNTVRRLVVGSGPTPRGFSSMVFDSARSRFVLFGGAVITGYPGSSSPTWPLADTWEFDLGPSPSFTPYGTGCTGSRGVPNLAAQTNSVPRTGTTFSARTSNLPWTAPTFLLFGLSNTNSSGLPLPFDLGIAGAPGCSLLASIDDIQATNNVLGTAVWSLAVPTLPGASFYVQSVAFEASANSLGVVLSNAGHGTLGF